MVGTIPAWVQAVLQKRGCDASVELSDPVVLAVKEKRGSSRLTRRFARRTYDADPVRCWTQLLLVHAQLQGACSAVR
jgi:hypothetical protein